MTDYVIHASMGRDLSTTPPAFHSDPLSLRSQRFRVKFSDSFPQSFPLISHLPYLLPSSVSCKSFACHSCENCRGVYQQFPFCNSPIKSPVQLTCRTVSDPYPPFPTPYPLSSHTLAHSFALFCTPQNFNSFLFRRFRTLCSKYRGWGAHPSSFHVAKRHRIRGRMILWPSD